MSFHKYLRHTESMLRSRDIFNGNQYATRRKFLNLADDTENVNQITGELIEYNDSIDHIDFRVLIERQYDNNRYRPIITMVIVGEELGI